MIWYRESLWWLVSTRLLLSIAAIVDCGTQQKHLGNCFKMASIVGENSHLKESLESPRELMSITYSRPS